MNFRLLLLLKRFLISLPSFVDSEDLQDLLLKYLMAKSLFRFIPFSLRLNRGIPWKRALFMRPIDLTFFISFNFSTGLARLIENNSIITTCTFMLPLSREIEIHWTFETSIDKLNFQNKSLHLQKIIINYSLLNVPYTRHTLHGNTHNFCMEKHDVFGWSACLPFII